MKVNSVMIMAACLALTLIASPLWAGSVTIASPDQAQTNAEGRVIKAKLTWSDKDQALHADITFSNELYETKGDTHNEEYFLFKFPGVMADPATKTYYAQDDSGQRVPVATWQNGFFGRHIKLSPGTCVHIQKEHGKVHVVMTATTAAKAALRNQWVEESSGLMIDSILGR